MGKKVSYKNDAEFNEKIEKARLGFGLLKEMAGALPAGGGMDDKLVTELLSKVSVLLDTQERIFTRLVEHATRVEERLSRIETLVKKDG